MDEKRGKLQDVGEGSLKVRLVEAPNEKLPEQTRVGLVGGGYGFTLYEEKGLALAVGEGGRKESVVGSKAGGSGFDSRPGGRQ